MRDYKGFIEKYFLILDKDSQLPVPFIFNKTQAKYYKLLQEKYPRLEGVREIVLKARQLGFSSFILALFTVDFLMIPHSVSICISHRKDATELLFKKVKFYIESFCEKMKYPLAHYLKTDNKNMLENRFNKAIFYVLTAGTKVGGRGGSAKNILFSESAFYEETSLITPQEIVLATAQQVPQGKGMIFIESTGNTENYFQAEWERSKRKENIYEPRFFNSLETYTEDWLEKKEKEFPNKALFLREYPLDESDAFLLSGTPYFDVLALKKFLDRNSQPVTQGRILPDGIIE